MGNALQVERIQRKNDCRSLLAEPTLSTFPHDSLTISRSTETTTLNKQKSCFPPAVWAEAALFAFGRVVESAGDNGPGSSQRSQSNSVSSLQKFRAPLLGRNVRGSAACLGSVVDRTEGMGRRSTSSRVGAAARHGRAVSQRARVAGGARELQADNYRTSGALQGAHPEAMAPVFDRVLGMEKSRGYRGFHKSSAATAPAADRCSHSPNQHGRNRQDHRSVLGRGAGL